MTFDGEDSFGAALIGYQFRHNALFLKLFAGIEAAGSIYPRASFSRSTPLMAVPSRIIGASRGRAIGSALA
jgi:hypothetical protein